jgi:lipopolysaccharide transport system ATP-binding protein
MVVSHDLEAIEGLCSRAICMSRGQLVDDGPASEVIARYRASVAAKHR